MNTWAGTGTLDGGGGDDNLVLGTNGDIDTVVGRFLVKGGDGKDTLTLDDSATSDDVDYIVTPTTVEMDPATPTPFGGVDYDPTVENVVLIGTTGDNNFLVTPSSNTTMRIYGSDPPYGALPPHGDGLKVDFTGTSGRKLITNIAPKGPGNAAWTFTDGHKPVIYVSMEKIQSSLFAATADTGQLSKPLVNIFETSSQSLVASFYAYPQTFRGGVRVTMADVNGDGIADVITSPGVGKVPGVAGDVVKVYDGAKLINMAPLTGQHFIANPDAALISSFKPEGSVYVGGLYLATGDVNGDGTLDLVTSRSTGSSLVRAFLNGGGGSIRWSRVCIVRAVHRERQNHRRRRGGCDGRHEWRWNCRNCDRARPGIASENQAVRREQRRAGFDPPIPRFRKHVFARRFAGGGRSERRWH